MLTLSMKRLIENSPPNNITPINKPTSSAARHSDPHGDAFQPARSSCCRRSLCFRQIAVTTTRNMISATRLMMPPREVVITSATPISPAMNR